nr:MAG TPA: hypothetical protein [Bacteriophage sp.]DAG13431.1 MAG TPA: hypothetical protein [Caudoviricetes sp.]
MPFIQGQSTRRDECSVVETEISTVSKDTA